MSAHPTPAGPGRTERPASVLDAASEHMTLVWIGAVVVTMAVGYGLDPVDEVATILASRGVTEAQTQATAFAAGFTLPVVVGTAVALVLVGTGRLERMDDVQRVLTVSAVFLAAGVLSGLSGLGLSPSLAETMPSAPVYVALPLFVLQAYLSSYGVALLLVGLAIGTASGLQAYCWSGRARAGA